MKRKRCYTTWWAHSTDECGDKASLQAKVEFWHSHLTPRAGPPTPHTEPSDEVIGIPPTLAARELSEFEMSTRLRSTLVLNNFWRLGDLDGVTYADLMQLRNCGKVTVTELKKLVEHLQAEAELLPNPPAAPPKSEISNSH